MKLPYVNELKDKETVDHKSRQINQLGPVVCRP